MTYRRFQSLPGWSAALRELDEARRGMERLFESATGFGDPRTAGVFPAINVTETPDSVFVRAELPGIEPAGLDITVENMTLSIAGERNLPQEAEQASYHRRERQGGSFRRSFTLPMRVEADDVQARYANGILTVELPKAAEVRPRRVQIQTGS